MPAEMIRLLVCHDCHTVEPLKDYEGRPEEDMELAAALRPHRSAGIPHNGNLFKVDESDWGLREKKDEILKQISLRSPGAGEGLGTSTYTMVDTFKEDAMACFQAHLRNPGCPDYRSDLKRLVPDTAGERKELGLVAAKDYDREGGQKTIYLCDYCPVQSMVDQARRKKQGMYK